MKELVFRHSGNFGDIVFSLHFVSDIIKWQKADKSHFILTYGRPAQYTQAHPDGNMQMTEKSANFAKAFIEKCGMFDEVHVIEWNQFNAMIKQVPNVVDLDLFRNCYLNFCGGDIRNWYYATCSHHFEKDFSKNLFEGKFEGDTRARNHVLVTYTERYNDYFISIATAVCNHKEEIGFIGIDREYERFCKLIDFKAKRFEINNSADAAYLMKGSRGVIGNSGGLYSLAEMLKVPRLLIMPQYMKVNDKLMYGPCNQLPLGGWCDIIQTSAQAVKLTDELFSLSH